MATSVEEDRGDLEPLLEYLRHARGFDFTGYKRPSLGRRIARRMQDVRVESYDTYVDYLEVHPEEFESLFNTILINVTAFFRDPPMWQYVADEVIPQLLARKKPDEPVRVWSTACASGEEAYTLAMLLCEAMDVDAFRQRVKIYATDVDEPALAQARRAFYPEAQVAAVPADLLEKYFEPSDDGSAFRSDLRRAVIFGRHDLVQDAPISRIDLLSCRNVLMYFNAETQNRILSRFQFALEPHGYLLLGKAETLLSRQQHFEPVDLKRRVFQATGRTDRPPNAPARVEGNGIVDDVGEAAFDAVTAALLVVDHNGYLVLANRTARNLFGVTSADLARPFRDLDASFRPVELRSLIEQAARERTIVSVGRVTWPAPAGPGAVGRVYDVEVTPLLGASGAQLGTTVTFTDVSRHLQLEEQLHAANRELENAYEELQSTNEELETTNEELQSTVEEMETTNEELQATNEELETMNEELQSANQELQTMNDDLRERSIELNRLNALLEAVFASVGRAVAVVSPDLTITVWNRQCEELWGVRRAEAEGSNLMSLDFGLPLDEVRHAIRACRDGSQPDDVVVEAVSRRGKPLKCTVRCTPIARGGATEAVVLAMDASLDA